MAPKCANMVTRYVHFKPNNVECWLFLNLFKKNEPFLSGNAVRILVKLIWSGWCLVLHVWITGVRVKSFQNSSLAYFLLKNHFWTKHATCSDPHSCQRTTPWLQMFTRSMSCLYSHPCPFTQICIQAHLQQCCMDGWVCMCIKLVLMIKRSLHAFYSWKVSMMLPRKSCWSFFENAHCVNAIKSNAVCFMLCTVVQIE